MIVVGCELHGGLQAGPCPFCRRMPPGTPAFRAHAPEWALRRGLPAPTVGESLDSYARRLGIDPAPLHEGLYHEDESLARLRLDTAIIRAFPRQWDAEVSARLARWRTRGRESR